MKCNNCDQHFSQMPDEDTDMAYGVLSVQEPYYPSVKILCPRCLAAAKQALRDAGHQIAQEILADKNGKWMCTCNRCKALGRVPV